MELNGEMAEREDKRESDMSLGFQSKKRACNDSIQCAV